MKKIFNVFILASIVACTRENASTAQPAGESKALNHKLLNDEFREKVLPKLIHDKSRAELAVILDALDKKNLKFCDVI